MCRLLCFISGMIAIIYVYKIWVDFGTSFACINFYMLIWDNKSLKINLLLKEIISLNAMYKLHFAYSDRQSCPCPFLETVHILSIRWEVTRTNRMPLNMEMERTVTRWSSIAPGTSGRRTSSSNSISAPSTRMVCSWWLLDPKRNRSTTWL